MRKLFLLLNWLVAMPASGTLSAQSQLPSENPRLGDCALVHTPTVGAFQTFDPAYSAATYITLTDERDSREYAVVKIGQSWIMAQNLNYQKDLTWQAYPNQPSSRYGGVVMEQIGSFWCPGGFGDVGVASTQASCATWGALYSWETAMMADGKWNDDSHAFRYWVEPDHSTNTSAGNSNNAGLGDGRHGLCPTGWHVPTDAEWGAVFNSLESGPAGHNSGYSYNGKTAGLRAKMRCSCPQLKANACVTDLQAAWFDLAVDETAAEPSLQLLPAGARRFDGLAFEERGLKAALWSSSAYSTGTAWYRRVSHDSGYVYRYVVSRSIGASIRCLKSTTREQ
jgi:uncharacterized protein (TIGR02145 family)